MSDLFMNKQRRRHQRWNPQQHLATADAASSSASTSFTATPIKKTSRSTRAGTPGALKANNNYFSYHIDNNDSSDELEYVEKSSQNTNNHNDYDPLANILSLQLRKPNHWKWELTTSKSCSNIALPRILLYDHKGNLLVDAPPDAGGDAKSEQIYKQEDYEPTPAKPKKRTYSSHRSATTNLTHSVRKALEKEFDGLHIEEVPPTPRKNSAFTTNTSTPTPTSTIRNRSRSHSRRPIDLHIGDLPDSSPRSSSLKGVRFNVDHDSKIPDFLPTPPSTTTPTTSSSSGPREKRKYRRSHSSGRLPSRTSSSILERLSYQKGRFSSPESEDGDEEDTAAGPRYSLRTDEAGTLIVHQDSSSSQNSRTRLRRKPQKYISSSDSLNRNETPSKLSLTPPVFDAAASPLT
ncbi:uncharacterized protein LOC133323924 [Musca vetustissima]|uniref:uncharacterized protein LOC133323924 n=1 Tax=Musca vetustissima TaxID=27455 RepID=UPI002AB6F1B3|nr:uncharacterized protein LOC133323924 [Musca vetustissima]